MANLFQSIFLFVRPTILLIHHKLLVCGWKCLNKLCIWTLIKKKMFCLIFQSFGVSAVANLCSTYMFSLTISLNTHYRQKSRILIYFFLGFVFLLSIKTIVFTIIHQIQCLAKKKKKLLESTWLLHLKKTQYLITSRKIMFVSFLCI